VDGRKETEIQTSNRGESAREESEKDEEEIYPPPAPFSQPTPYRLLGIVTL